MPDRPTYRPVHKALHRPLTIWGVDGVCSSCRRCSGAATFNLFYSFLAGLLMSSGLYGLPCGRRHATRDAPDSLASSKARRRYDPGKHDRVDDGGRAMVRIGRILRDYRTRAASTACWRCGGSSTTRRS